MPYVNMCPHPVGIVRKDGSVLEMDKFEGEAPRVFVQNKVVAVIEGVEHFDPEYGEVTWLPEPVEGVWYIVSALVKTRAPHRSDLVSPGVLLRDSQGNVIGARGVSRRGN